MKSVKACAVCAVTLLWMLIIFCFSAQAGNDSSAMSSPIAQKIAQIVHPSFETMEAGRQEEVLGFWTLIVRKGGHLTEYLLLGMLVSLSLCSIRSAKLGGTVMTRALGFKIQLCALLIGIGYAVTDELHQRFVPGRSGRLSDVLLDSIGVAIGVGLISLLAKIKSVCRSNRQTQ